jgi:hypothetical protein
VSHYDVAERTAERYKFVETMDLFFVFYLFSLLLLWFAVEWLIRKDAKKVWLRYIMNVFEFMFWVGGTGYALWRMTRAWAGVYWP